MASSTTSDGAPALADVLPLLCEHLTAGALFRARVALGRRGEEPAGVAHLLAARMGLAPRPARPMAWLAARLRVRSRCRECGAPTARAVRVCHACADDGAGLHALRDRAHARWLNRQRAAPHRNFEAMLRRARPAARTATGRLLYWRRDLERLVA